MRRWLSFAVVVFVVVLFGAVVSPAGATSSANGRIAFSTHFVLPFGDRGVGAQVFSVGAGEMGGAVDDECRRRRTRRRRRGLLPVLGSPMRATLLGICRSG